MNLSDIKNEIVVRWYRWMKFERRRREWSRKTFVLATPCTVIAHLREELDELEAAIDSGDRISIRTELADVGLLYRDLVDRLGLNVDSHHEDLEDKHETNEGRKWRLCEDGVSRHVEADS